MQNEFVCTVVIALIVFTVVDPTNAFVSISTGTWLM